MVEQALLTSTTNSLQVSAMQRMGQARGMLARFLAVLVLVTGLLCLYQWQASTVAATHRGTQTLLLQVHTLEQQNRALMLRVAALERPEYIATKAQNSGFVPAPAPLYVQVPGKAPARPVAQQRDVVGDWWRNLTDQLRDQIRVARSVPGLVKSLGLR